MSCKNCDGNCENKNKHNHHEHHSKEEKQSKVSFIFYCASIIVFLLTFLPVEIPNKVILYLLVVLLSGYELILEGIKNIFRLNFEEDTLMTIAVIAAFILGEFPESCMVVLLFRLGEFLEEKAIDKSNQSVESIVKIKAKTANRRREDGKIEVVAVEKLQIGDTICIKPGEIVPVDCVVIEGKSNLDTSSITGESKQVFVEEETKLISGSINLTGSVTCKVEKDFANSTASQIVDLVYQATNNKGETEKFITRFSKIYTPIVILLAIGITVIPSLFFGGIWKDWILRALVFLVASCPCSIIISVPLAFFSSVGAISKKGMLVKGTKHIEKLANSKQIAFDKTGTITTGKMEIEKIEILGELKQEEILAYIYALEKNSNHPISTAIAKKVENEKIKIEKEVKDFEEIPGYGVKASIDGKIILFGNRKLMEREDVSIESIKEEANYFAINGKLEAYVTLKEEIRKEAKELIKKLEQEKFQNILMLTGDNKENAEKIAQQVEIEKVYSNLLPKEKMEIVKQYKEKGEILFVGDGMNDGPVLAESSFGIAMGEGTEIAGQIADGILISNQIEVIPETITIARKTMNIVKFNITFSLMVKAIVLILGILGIAPIWLAIVADTGVSLLTVLNSMRILKNTLLV